MADARECDAGWGCGSSRGVFAQGVMKIGVVNHIYIYILNMSMTVPSGSVWCHATFSWLDGLSARTHKRLNYMLG